MKQAVLTSLIAILLASAVAGFDVPRSRSDAAGGTIRLSETSASGLVALPVGGISPGEFRIEAGFRRQFDLSELDQTFIAAAWRTHAVTLSFGMSQLGQTDYYSERILKAGGAFHYDSVTVGTVLSGEMVDIGNGYGQLRAASIGGAVAYRYNQWLGAFMADDLNGPRLYQFSEKILPKFSFYGELLGMGRTALSVRATYQKREKPQFGLSESLRLSPAAELFLGISSQPMKYGAGINIRIKNAIFTYGSSIHPTLGLTHTVTLGYSRSGSGKKALQ